MPRLVRRKPLKDRILAVLNPIDTLLWLSEEIETREWDSNLLGTQFGLGLNFVLLLARANSAALTASDDIFRDDVGPGWVAYLVHPLVWFLAILSVTNAMYAMTKTRKYRLLQADVEVKPKTSSARRVKVQSDIGSSSPLRYIAEKFVPESAESRSHPEKAIDVWEISVWDPLPICLRMLCFFSPGHVLVYLLFLPLAPLDPRPSVTVFNTLLVQTLLSAQLLWMSRRYTQQAKDQAIIQKEVMNEYNTKFVQPRLHPVVRDAGTQISDIGPREVREMVSTGTPTTLIRHGFYTREQSRSMTPDIAGMNNMNTMDTKLFTPRVTSRYTESHTSTNQTPLASSHQSMAPVSDHTSNTTATPGAAFRQNLHPAGSTPYGQPLTPGVSIATITEKLHRTPIPRQQTPGIPSSAATTESLNRSPSRRSLHHIDSTAPTPKAAGLENIGFESSVRRSASTGSALGESTLGQASARTSRLDSSYDRRQPSGPFRTAEAQEPLRPRSPVKMEGQGSGKSNPFAPVRQRGVYERDRYPSRRF